MVLHRFPRLFVVPVCRVIKSCLRFLVVRFIGGGGCDGNVLFSSYL